MSRIFITGSSDGLGLIAAKQLAEEGHDPVLHARNEERAEHARSSLPTASAVAIGDVSSMDAIRSVAAKVNTLGRCDAVIHNVGIGYREPQPVRTVDGLSLLFTVNVLAPYLLTALIMRPRRLVYLSSGLHRSGDDSLDDLQWENRRWNGHQAYADTKLHDTLLAFAVARRWPETFSNAVEPGWVPTKMGGPNAPDDLAAGALTQAWLAAGEDPATGVSGRYFYHQQEQEPSSAARRADLQDRLLDYCRRITGVEIA